MSIKYVLLLLLTLQNSALILTMRYSRTIPGPKYKTTTTVLLSEILKTTLSASILLFTRWRAERKSVTPLPEGRITQGLLRDCGNDVLQLKAVIPIMVPAILYTIQNNLQYLAASNLDSVTFQVMYQGKILTTAFFAVLILRQKLTIVKWFGIFVLMIGLILVTYPSSNTTSVRNATVGESRMIGLLAILTACFLSGFAGVFLEVILKRAKDHTAPDGSSQLWVRNVQLSLVSIGIAFVAAAYVDGASILHDGFFYGYNVVTWCTLLLHAVGGLFIGLVIAYADNILKNFAISASMVLSTIISTVTGDVIPSQQLIIGVMLVIAASNIYGLSWEKKTVRGMSEDESTPLPLDSVDRDIEASSNEKSFETGIDRDVEGKQDFLVD